MVFVVYYILRWTREIWSITITLPVIWKISSYSLWCHISELIRMIFWNFEHGGYKSSSTDKLKRKTTLSWNFCRRHSVSLPLHSWLHDSTIYTHAYSLATRATWQMALWRQSNGMQLQPGILHTGLDISDQRSHTYYSRPQQTDAGRETNIISSYPAVETTRLAFCTRNYWLKSRGYLQETICFTNTVSLV